VWTGSRVIAIDDDKNDLTGIVAALHGSHIGVLPFHFRGQKSLKKCARGVRLVFADINISPSTGGPYQQHMALASALSVLLDDRNGPWVLVGWTASPDQIPDLLDVLRQSLGRGRPPIAGLGLDKSSYTLAGGRYDIGRIIKALNTAITSDPVAGAVLDLEERAADAAHDVMTSIAELASGSSTADLAQVLVELSNAIAPGAPEPELVFQTLGPAFQDRLIRRGVEAAEKTLWSKAFASASGAALSAQQRAQLNTTLHLAPTASKAERGALTLIPTAKHAELERLVGDLQSLAFSHFIKRDKTVAELKKQHKSANGGTPNPPPFDEQASIKGYVETCRWALVELVPVCDAANNKRGVRRAALALLTPDDLAVTAAGDYAYTLPVLRFLDRNAQLVVSAKVTFSPIPRSLNTTAPEARLRDQLLDVLTQHISASQSRLGLVSF
jgi:hypothetical protein